MYDKRSFLSGLAMGLTGKGDPIFTASDTFTKGYKVGAALRRKRVILEKEPVAYLYNGVRLPDINSVWDREKYPYAYIEKFYGGYNLGIFDFPMHVERFDADSTELNVKASAAGKTKWYLIDNDTGEFTLYYENSNVKIGDFVSVASDSVWTSHTLINTEDNSVYLAASEPVPVYE